MADGPPPLPLQDPREAAAAELARALSTAGGQRLFRDLQRLGIVALPPEPATELPAEPAAAAAAGPPAPAPAGARPISIWTPRPAAAGDAAGEIVWTRPPRLPLGDHYATAPELRSRRGGRPRRIAFFGESAAAGYLHAPHRTPAGVLAAQLRAVAGEMEVIDLARTNETLAPLVETVRAAMQLSPDLLVIYAGNNWSLLETPELSPYPPSVRGRQRLAETLRDGGALGPAQRARERLAGLAGAALAEIAEIAEIAAAGGGGGAAAAGVPVVLVVPEVNLADWETRQPPIWLPGGGTARWYAALESARMALAAGRFAAAEAAAWTMVELDGGSGPVPFRLLAAALRGQGRDAAARDACISEVDSVHYPLLAFLAAPQATTLARELLLAFARDRPRWAAVDLRPVFAAWTGSPLPGRRLFLDYCHLTAEGMTVAMAAAAAQALRLLGLGEPAWEDIARRPAALETGSVATDAAALLGAAIHTAHRMLPVTPADGGEIGDGPRIDPWIAPWIEKALDASPAAIDALLDLADARTAPLSTVLTAAQQRNLASPCRLELQHGWVYDFLDGDVLAAASAALAARGLAGDARAAAVAAEIEELLLSRLGVGAAGTDIAAPFFHAEPLARFYPELIGEPGAAARAHHRAPSPESAFHLVADGRRDVRLTLTARLAEAARRGGVRIAVNGAGVGELALAGRWTSGAVTAPRARLRRGLNRVTLRWPELPPAGERPLEAAIRRLEEGLEADLHPVFGEVWSLVAWASP